MDDQNQDDQLQSTYNSSVSIRDVSLKTFWKQWTIGMGGERGSGISIFTNPSARAGYDTRSSFKRSLAGLNSEFSF